MPVRSAPSQQGQGQGQQEPVTYPKMVADPVWSLRPADALVEACGWEFRVTARSAADWLEVLMDPDGMSTYDLVPGMLSAEDAEVFEDLLLEGDLTVEQADQLALDLLSTVSGRPWWVATKLVGSVQHHWERLGGEMVIARIDPAALSLSAWLDAALAVCAGAFGQDRKNLALFLDKLAEPPADQVREQLDEGIPMAQFTSMM